MHLTSGDVQEQILWHDHKSFSVTSGGANESIKMQSAPPSKSQIAIESACVIISGACTLSAKEDHVANNKYVRGDTLQHTNYGQGPPRH